ncbi:hypothetical protein LP416_01850 [Polaromonas sp. P2-4]|nr:hypothetical protein LP416_01850 [Polaromonas sp. P2-4]
MTTVTVTYGSAVLDDLCCHRKKTGNTSWNANPCEKNQMSLTDDELRQSRHLQTSAKA